MKYGLWRKIYEGTRRAQVSLSHSTRNTFIQLGLPKSRHGGFGTVAMEALVPFSFVIALAMTLNTIPASVDETFNHFGKFPLGPALPIAT